MRRELYAIAKEARLELAQRQVPAELLGRLYAAYDPEPDISTFLRIDAPVFPTIYCGLASVYLRHKFQEGEVVDGRYDGQFHTVLRLGGTAIVDITADQFGGPAVYVGEPVPPWELPESTS